MHRAGEGWTVLGVTSFGPSKCGDKVLPGVYTRVESYTDWIAENTGIQVTCPLHQIKFRQYVITQVFKNQFYYNNIIPDKTEQKI